MLKKTGEEDTPRCLRVMARTEKRGQSFEIGRKSQKRGLGDPILMSLALVILRLTCDHLPYTSSTEFMICLG